MGFIPPEQAAVDLFDEVKRLQKENAAMLERIPHTADGVPIFLGDELWFYEEDTREPLALKCDSISVVREQFRQFYEGGYCIGTEWHEGGNLDYYHRKENVPVPNL